MSDEHDELVRQWRENAAREDDENFRFLRSLKMVSDESKVDAQARQAHEDVFARIDCTRCANCCQTMHPVVSDEDMRRIAKRLRMSRTAFFETYVEVDAKRHEQRIRGQPCPFLGNDLRCTIYEDRPTVCREYPHTDKEGFTWRTHLHSANALKCPAVYHIVKQMRKVRSRR